MPLITFVMPIYNVEKYVENAILSVVNQIENDEAELICIDDGSEDKSGSIADELSEKYPFMHVIHSENKGVSTARNKGIEAAKGRYIVFVDADDAISENAVVTLKNHLTKNNPDILVFGGSVMNSDEMILPQDLHDAISPENKYYSVYKPEILFCEKGMKPFVWNCAFKRELIYESKVRFDKSLTLGEDHAFLMCIVPFAKSFSFIEDKIYLYRYGRSSGATEKYCADECKRCACHIDVFKSVSEHWNKYKLFVGAEQYFCKWTFDFVINSVLLLENKKSCLEYAKKIRDISRRNNIPYNRCNIKIKLKYQLVNSEIMLKAYFVYRRIAGYVK